MRGSFRSRLFVLLLIFAAAPVVLLTLLGYYLVAATPTQSQATGKAALEHISDYYGALIDSVLRDRLAAYTSNGTTDGLDFVFTYTDGTISELGGDSALTPEAAAIIGESAAQREAGLTEAGGRLYQYVATAKGDGSLIVAGMLHDPSLLTLIDEVKLSGARTSTSRELRGKYIVFAGGLLIVIVAVTLLAAWYFSSRASRRLAGPLIALAQASERIAHGEFNETVDIRADGEIGRLVDSFNRMVLRLDEATARLAQTERVAAWRQLARRFAHELKNPLQPILVSLYRIEKQLTNTPQWEQVREPVQAAASEVRHLTELADRFSGLAKLPPPKVTPIDLKALVRSVTDLYREKLQPFAFSVDLPERDVTVSFDETYLREAVHNLLQNAADACHDGDAITVGIEDETDFVWLTVRDTGPGMDAATLAAARLPYFTTKQKGTGLGLAIVDKFMTELGGRLKVLSAPGQGTAATLVLPKETSDAR